MPLGTPGYYGTNADGSENNEYCKFCYQKGEFTQPDLTMEGMIDSSVHHMTTSMDFPKEKAMEMSNQLIPTLKRWKHAEAKKPI